MIQPEETITIGRITRTHGRQGEIQCRMNNSLWDEADATFLILLLNNILVPFRVEDWRGKGEDLIFRLNGIQTEQQALPLIGAEAYMLRKDINHPEDEDDLLTWQDLVGYQVFAMDGEEMGNITEVDESTANIVASTNSGKLLPLHEDLILSLQPDEHIIQLNIPSSL